MDWDRASWQSVYPPQCSGTPGTSYPSPAHLCCQTATTAKSTPASCRLCASTGYCGGSYPTYAGRIMAHSEWKWPSWIKAFDNTCGGEPQHRANPGAGFSLCCNTPVCSFCSSCGGDWPQETSRLAINDVTSDFWRLRSYSCSGSVDDYNSFGSRGVSLCCKKDVTSEVQHQFLNTSRKDLESSLGYQPFSSSDVFV